MKYVVKPFVWIWDFTFFFFGFTYEKQASKVDFEKMDPALRGPQNAKTSHTIRRANRASPRVYE
jgi:hypothetical protein